MAIFRSRNIRQGALGASQQGQLGQFLGQHPIAQQRWNQAARAGGGRQQMLGMRNAQMTLGQASGGRPMPFNGAGGLRGLPGGGMSPAPPTAYPMPPGAMFRGPQYTTLGGQPGFQAPGGGPMTPQFAMHPGIGGIMGQVNPGMQSVLGSRLGQMGGAPPMMQQPQYRQGPGGY